MLTQAIFDIETWDLGSEFGPLICACVLIEPEGKMITLRQDTYVKRGLAEDMSDDHALCVELRDLLATRHVSVGYFSKGFDIPHLNSRLALHGETLLLPPQMHIDPIWAFKGWRGIRARSAKMKHMAEFFGLEQKPDVSAEVWLKARGGNKRAIDEVVERCAADVRITKALALKALELGLIRRVERWP